MLGDRLPSAAMENDLNENSVEKLFSHKQMFDLMNKCRPYLIVLRCIHTEVESKAQFNLQTRQKILV